MTDQSSQIPEHEPNLEELRQSLLDQSSIEQNVREELSNEELEAIAGGALTTGAGEVTAELHDSASLSPSPSLNSSPANSGGLRNWIKKPSSQVAVMGPVVSAAAAFSVGFVNKAAGGK